MKPKHIKQIQRAIASTSQIVSVDKTELPEILYVKSWRSSRKDAVNVAYFLLDRFEYPAASMWERQPINCSYLEQAESLRADGVDAAYLTVPFKDAILFYRLFPSRKPADEFEHKGQRYFFANLDDGTIVENDTNPK